MPKYLIAHTDKAGANIAQATVDAKTEQAALKAFAQRFPERVVTSTGIRGQQ